MKATKQFAQVIGEYIEKAKQEDPLFAKCVDDQPKKTVEGCVNYILKTVKDSGVAGWTDDEIFGMARHFFDERDLKDPGAISARVVVNHHVELTDKEKRHVREEIKRLNSKARDWEAFYAEKKGRYFGVTFDNGDIFCHVISSVAEMVEEGETMHHCVYQRGYYKKPESLILSARDRGGNRLETVEVNLDTFSVVQSRGLQNHPTLAHNDIVKLVEANMKLIKKATSKNS